MKNKVKMEEDLPGIKMVKQKQPKFRPLKPLYGSHKVEFTELENKLKILARNQEIIYKLVQKIHTQNEQKAAPILGRFMPPGITT